MFKKIKKWYQDLSAEGQENCKVALGILAVLAILGLAVAMGFVSAADQSEEGENISVCESSSEQGIVVEFPVVYADTVPAIAVYRGTTFKNSHSYTEIVFGHDLYFYYSEVSGSVRHYDYNDPVYVEEGDLCVVWVETDGEEETVTLVENLTKKSMAIPDAYFDYVLEDRD